MHRPFRPETFQQTEDYYALLGLPKQADSHTIQLRAKEIHREFHPDKFATLGEECRQEAHHYTSRVTAASEILMDSQKRMIYDQYGHEGLQYALVLHKGTADEVHRLVHQQRASAATKRIIRRCGPGADATAAFDARPLAASLFANGSSMLRQRVSKLHPVASKVVEKLSVKSNASEAKDVRSTSQLLNSFRQTSLQSVDLKHFVQAPLSKSTKLEVSTIGRLSSNNSTSAGALRARLSHSFSQAVSGKITASTGHGVASSIAASLDFDFDSGKQFSASVGFGGSSVLPPSIFDSQKHRQRIASRTPVSSSRLFKASSSSEGPLLDFQLPSFAPAFASLHFSSPLSSSSTSSSRLSMGAKASSNPTVSMAIEKVKNERNISSITAKASVSGPSLSLNYQRELSSDSVLRYGADLRLPWTRPVSSSLKSVAASLGELITADWYYTLEKQLSSLSTFEIGLASTEGAGLLLNLGYSRGPQRIRIPILLSTSQDEDQNNMAAQFTVFGMALHSLLKMTVLNPMQRRRELRQLLELRLRNASLVRDSFEAARGYTMLVTHSAQRQADRLRRRNGLVIQNAIYGYLDAKGDPIVDPCISMYPADAQIDPLWIDVTVVLQHMVTYNERDNHTYLIMLPEVERAKMSGFIDPCPGMNKIRRLRIRYKYNGGNYFAVYDDREAVQLPSTAHMVL